MTLSYLQYPNCSTCRKAAKWLTAQGLEFTSIDLVKTPPTATELADLHARSGLPIKRFFNTSGLSYRGGAWKDRLPGLSDQEAYEALAADGKLIKRPILDNGIQVLVGFREAEYAELLT